MDKVCLKMKKLVSFVVPVYNEEENLHEFHRRLGEVMQAQPYDYDLIFVDDGSSDNSHLILAELAEKMNMCRCIFIAQLWASAGADLRP